MYIFPLCASQSLCTVLLLWITNVWLFWFSLEMSKIWSSWLKGVTWSWEDFNLKLSLIIKCNSNNAKLQLFFVELLWKGTSRGTAVSIACLNCVWEKRLTQGHGEVCTRVRRWISVPGSPSVLSYASFLWKVSFPPAFVFPCTESPSDFCSRLQEKKLALCCEPRINRLCSGPKWVVQSKHLQVHCPRDSHEIQSQWGCSSGLRLQ